MISFNDIVMLFDGMDRSQLRSDTAAPAAAAGRRRLRSSDAHLTDTVKHGQFRENDLKELNLS